MIVSNRASYTDLPKNLKELETMFSLLELEGELDVASNNWIH